MVGPGSRSESYEDFEAVAQLEPVRLRHLLVSGEEIERVWAAWALALKLGQRVQSELAVTVNSHPQEGLRRHLLGILGGFGAMDVLSVFACSDPEPLVRGTACLYMLQTRRADDRKVAELLISRLAGDNAAVVREIILSNASAHELSVPLELLIALAEDESPAIRRMSVQLLGDKHAAQEAVKAGLEKCIENETEPELIMMLADLLLEAGRKEKVFNIAKAIGGGLQEHLLESLIAREAKFRWHDLEQLAKSSAFELVEFQKLVDPTDLLLMLQSLSTWLAAKLTNPAFPYASGKPYRALQDVICIIEPKSISADTSSALQIILSAVANDLALYEIGFDDDDNDELNYRIPLRESELSGLKKALSRLVKSERT